MATRRPALALPPGWRAIRRRGRPTYKRRDGVRVRLDAPGRWGVTFPEYWATAQLPMQVFEEQTSAMEWVNRNYPEGA